MARKRRCKHHHVNKTPLADFSFSFSTVVHHKKVFLFSLFHSWYLSSTEPLLDQTLSTELSGTDLL